MADPLPIPQSALDRFLLIKWIGDGKDGDVYLTVSKPSPKDPNTRRALKVLGSMSTVEKSFLESLQKAQDDPDYPVVRLCEYDEKEMGWYTMAMVPGIDIHELLQRRYPSGFPPYLVLKVLEHVYKAQRYLHQKGWCHRDIQTGVNIMLHKDSPTSPFELTLVDYDGIKAYNPDGENICLQNFYMLASEMTKYATRVPKEHRKPHDRSGFEQNDLRKADHFYDTFVKGRHTLYGEFETVEGFWSAHGGELERLAGALKDEVVDQELQEVLSVPKVMEEDISRVITQGGL
ncbi:hypothetical protein EK21DRAFT_112597 [Setomelanomma holmii]|uniref:Protein kinase domain-containing protein n=1 Tax=Setomelanomma holmii TaxID=210430 RepID=A0A9P4H7U5_9PLEO|nr:hypothetical protein EK21DRAFT_112597 [Setomelanomma holmii]